MAWKKEHRGLERGKGLWPNAGNSAPSTSGLGLIDRGRASPDLAVKLHHIPQHSLGPRSPEGEDRVRHWN